VRDFFVRDRGRILPWIVAAASLAIGLAIIRPFADVPVSFDTQSTVAYFDRLIRGTHLEQALTTTPKPLLTVVEGGLHAITGDWRPIVWLTMLIQAAAAGLAASLVGRAVGWAAGAGAGLVIAGTSLLIEDAAFGNAVPWALLGWLVAAGLLTGPRPRPRIAGLVLALAALCRLETLVIVSVMGLAITWARFGPWPYREPRPVVPRGIWAVVVLPFAALPIMLLHDWLLTGDAFFWLKVSRAYSDAVRERGIVVGPVEKVAWFARRYLVLWPALVLGLAGAISLFRLRQWGVFAGLVAVGPGIAAFIVLLAARGLYAPERYALPVDLALFILAAVGFGWIVNVAASELAKRFAGGNPAMISGAVTVAGFALAVAGLAATTSGPFDARMAGVIRDLRTLNENTARVVRTIGPETVATTAGVGVAWVVPTAVRPRFAIDLDVSLQSVAGLSTAWLDPSTSSPLNKGQVVYHDTQGDVPRGAYAALETGSAVVIGAATLQPILLDPSRGLWLYAVDRP
jgi:hypothetical protein